MNQNKVNSLSQSKKEEQYVPSSVPLTELKELLSNLPLLDYEIIEKQCNVISKYNKEEQYKQFALLCQSKGHVDPDWLLLAGQIRIKYIKNTVPKKFSESTIALRCILRDDYYNFVMKNAKKLDVMVQKEKDYKFNLFAVETLLKSYLARIKKDGGTTILETPQYMYMRVATFLWFDSVTSEGSFSDIEKMYQDLSNGRYSMASPTMFNSGLFRSQLASCFAAGTKVNIYNKTYPIPIQDVKIGDGVFTHLGNVKKVTQLHKNPLNERKLYKIRVSGTHEIKVTDNHRFWAVQKHGNGKPKWIPIEFLQPGDFIASSPDPNNLNPSMIDDESEYNMTFHGMFRKRSKQYFYRFEYKVEVEYKPEFVYTLGVEDDHSYCVEGLVAENCFLYNLGDSMQSISKGWHDAAIISMNSGGLGIDFSSLRHSEIGQHGQTSGIVPWIKIMDQILITVDQGSKRKGSGTAYLCCWHLDIEEFLDLRKASGPEDMRARDMFYALWVSDEFMRRVEKDEDWTLFCPNKAPKLDEKWGLDFEIAYRGFEKKVRSGKITHFRTVKARELWKRIILTQIETGMPFILYKDAINRKSNQKNLGTTRLSNLCVHGDTHILTDQGQIPIQELENKEVNIWNGEEWSGVTVRKTGENKNLLTVELSNGVEINCTPEHKFHIKKTTKSKVIEMEARDLVEGLRLIKYSLPDPISFEEEEEFPHAYTHGFFCGDGSYTKCKRPRVNLYGKKCELLEHLAVRSHGEYNKKSDCYYVMLDRDLRPKFEVPSNASTKDRLDWFAGYADADGCIYRNGKNECLGISCIHKDFLSKVRLMLQTLGIDSKVIKIQDEKISVFPGGKKYTCKPQWRLCVSSVGLYQLQKIGFNTKRLDMHFEKPSRNASHFVTIVKVIDGPQNVDTFCFTEKKRNMGMFNGVLSGQCTEITLFTDKENIASCNLGSIVLNSCVKINSEGKSYFDFDDLERLTREMTKNINQMIDRNYYPPEVPQIKYTNLKNRPLGIGVQGLADTFAMLDLAWTNDEARQLNEMIFETMYYSAVSESVELAKKFGSYETFRGSPASEGLFQFDLWDSEKLQKDFEGETKNKPFITSEFLNNHAAQRRGPITNRYDWNGLREEMMKYGMRNSMLMALMPTASSASILGNHESFEPYTQHFYARTVLSGQYIVINKHLIGDLQKINMWKTDTLKNIMQNGGSITNLSEDGLEKETIERLKFLKEKYLTVFEIPQKVLVDMSLDRGRYVCQTQSFNCWMSEPNFNRLNKFHFYGWKGGAKTGMYYLRQTARTDPTNFSIGEMNIPTRRQLAIKSSKFECNDEVCVSCSS